MSGARGNVIAIARVLGRAAAASIRQTAALAAGAAVRQLKGSGAEQTVEHQPVEEVVRGHDYAAESVPAGDHGCSRA